MARIYTIHKGNNLEIACYNTQDEALNAAMQYPAGQMFLCWQGTEQVSPCWIRFEKGGTDHFVAAFLLSFEGGAQALLLALSRNGEAVHDHAASLGTPPEGNFTAMVTLVEAEVGPTCLAPE